MYRGVHIYITYKYKGFLPKTKIKAADPKESKHENSEVWEQSCQAHRELKVQRPPNKFLFAFCFQFLRVAVWELVPNPQVQHINGVYPINVCVRTEVCALQ